MLIISSRDPVYRSNAVAICANIKPKTIKVVERRYQVEQNSVRITYSI
jgi:hypothetical protein